MGDRLKGWPGVGRVMSKRTSKARQVLFSSGEGEVRDKDGGSGPVSGLN